MDDKNRYDAGNNKNPDDRSDTRKYENGQPENGHAAYYQTAVRHNDPHSMPLWYVKSKITIQYVLGVIETLLLFRFLFRLLGANPGSGFVTFVYSITAFLIAPFSGIFNPFTSGGLVTKSVFEPAVLIAMLVYVIAAWGLVNLLRLKAHRND